MAEKIIPDIQTFAAEILQESKADFPTQQIKIVERLLNFAPEKMPELHLQEWYRNFWKFAGLAPYMNTTPEVREGVCWQILDLVKRQNNSVRRQYFALALLLLGKVKESQTLMNQSLWSKNLRDDFEIFERWNKLANAGLNLQTRAALRRNEQIKNFLQEKYAELIKKYEAAAVEDCPRVKPKDYRIYFCWFQGEENLPPLVRCCYNSLKLNAGKYKVCFIDENNYADYVKLPEHILQKFADGKISRTHFSDILRVSILDEHGGLWLDSTILVAEPLENHKKLWKLPYFTQKFYNEKDNDCPYAYNPSYGRWATFAQGAAVRHYPLLAFMKEFFNEYWRDFDAVIDYVLMDFAMDIAYENIPAVRAGMDAVPINNPDTNTLVRFLNAPYKNYPYDKVLAETFLHKLNWRVQLDLQTPDTVFREIQRRYGE